MCGVGFDEQSKEWSFLLFEVPKIINYIREFSRKLLRRSAYENSFISSFLIKQYYIKSLFFEWMVRILAVFSKFSWSLLLRFRSQFRNSKKLDLGIRTNIVDIIHTIFMSCIVTVVMILSWVLTQYQRGMNGLTYRNIQEWQVSEAKKNKVMVKKF